ncbi:alpha/beta fold hydrolase [Paenibacillus agaridevorans]|uniref:alpha/beta fold hydrolase n=1 Tax=Paenibacillus agaridevorans TaxID=171404 RepID=UPI000D59DB82|nr:alpha/beta hydrolase [Paenibacillus agaridevorans]
MNRKRRKTKKAVSIILALTVIVVVALAFPTWTPSIKGENSIATLEQVKLNGAWHEIMIRGADRNNPIVIFVHGGPGCSEIPYVRKYQERLEKQFTIVHYDQRGSGKSHRFGEDYSDVTAGLLVEDLFSLTDYVADRLGQSKVILIGHSYGTYLGLQAVAASPEKFAAYIGIGQVANHHVSELDSFAFALGQATEADDKSDIRQLEGMRENIEAGRDITPRSLIRKYGGAARLIDDNRDYVEGFLMNREYNLLDVIRYARGIAVTQDRLLNEESMRPITSLVKKLELPVYFVMGAHDYMTSTKAAKAYFEELDAPDKTFIVYEHSAHYPQFEEEERFAEWMETTFRNE